MEEIKRIEQAVTICNERDILKQQIEEYQEILNTKYATVDQYKAYTFDTEAPKGLFLILSIALGLGIGLLMSFIGLNNGVAAGLSLVFMFVIYNVLFKSLFHKTRQVEYDEYKQLLVQAENEKPTIQNIISEASKQLNDLVDAMRNEEYCIIPEMYWDNANFIYALIKNKRAYDLVSAINKFEDISHQSRMEQMAAENLAMTQEVLYVTQMAEENSRVAAENAKKAAQYSGISALFSVAAYCDVQDIKRDL